MIVGYARVRTVDQNLELQLDALERAGCERVFRDQVSGAREDGPGWREARAALRVGDTLVVWRLDRLGRSLKHLIDVITELDEQGIGFKSVQESLDTTTPLLEDPEQTVKGVAVLRGVGRSTLYRTLERHAQAEAADASLQG